MSELIREFLVGYGFQVDDSSRARAEANLKAAEGRISSTHEAEAAKRADLDKKTAADRATSAKSTGDSVVAAERKTGEALDKVRRDNADRSHKYDAEHAKRSNNLRNEQFKQAEAAILRFSSVASALGAGINGALSVAPFGAFIKSVATTASSLSDVDVMAKRIGTSVQSIMRLRYAFKQAGVSEAEADSSLENFSARSKPNPDGFRGMLKGLGVKTEDENGKPITDIEKLYENSMKYLGAQQYNLALARANQWGTGENALIAGRDQPTFNANLQKADEKYKGFGLDPNKAASDAREFQKTWDDLSTDLEAVKIRIEAGFFTPILKRMDELAKWFEAHPDMTVKMAEGLTAFSGLIAARVLPNVIGLIARLTGLSSVFNLLPRALLVALGLETAVTAGLAVGTLAATTSSANAGEPTVAPNGTMTYPDGHQEKGKVWDGHSTAEAPKDERNWWQKVMPKALGGQDAPMVAHGAHGASIRERRGSDAPVSNAGAPGANGYGLIDAPYRGPLDRKGEGGHLSPRELFSYLKSKGATDNEATMLTGAAGSESSFNPNAVHDGGHGHGLWGHNDARLDMRGRNWQEQADAALHEVQHDGYAAAVNGARTPQELTDAQMHYERPRGYNRRNPRGGDNYTGRLHTIDSFARGFGTLGNGQSAPATASTSGTIGDKAAFDAQQRIIAGKARTGDPAMFAEHLRQQNTPAKPTSPIGDIGRMDRAKASDAPVKVDLTDASAAKITPHMAEAAQHLANMRTVLAASHGHLFPFINRHALGETAALRASVSHSLKKGGDFNRQGDTFNVHTSDARSGLDAAHRLSARREGQDRIRYMEGSVG